MTKLQVRRTACSTCIYRTDSPADLATLEEACIDPMMPGFFERYRQCHHHDHRTKAGQRVCRGFWARHANRFQAGQVAQRLGVVEYTDAGDNHAT